MNHKAVFLTLLGIGFVSAPFGTARAADAPVSVTGCLTQGDEANEYAIRDTSGKTFGLKSSKVNLKSHLNHQVTVTGTPTKENEAAEKNEKKSGKPEESEHLRVTDLKMISTTCQ